MNNVSLIHNCVMYFGNECPFFVVGKIFTFRLKKMNTTEINKNWKNQKSELKQKFAFLTDNDLIFEEGAKEEMFRKLQIRLGKTKEELNKIIAAL